MFYSNVAGLAVAAAREYRARVRGTNVVRHEYLSGRINDPRALEHAEMLEEGAYYDWQQCVNFSICPEFCLADYANDMTGEVPKFFPVGQIDYDPQFLAWINGDGPEPSWPECDESGLGPQIRV
jgi:hypothetical protein